MSRVRDLRLEVEDSDVTDDVTVALIGCPHLSVSGWKKIRKAGALGRDGLALGLRGLELAGLAQVGAGRLRPFLFFLSKTFFLFFKKNKQTQLLN